MNRNDSGQRPGQAAATGAAPGGGTPAPQTQQDFRPQGPGSYTSTGGPSAPAQPYPGGPAGPPPKQKSWFARHKILTALLAIVALFVVVGIVGGGDDDAGTAGADDPGAVAVTDDADADDDGAGAEQEGADGAEQEGADGAEQEGADAEQEGDAADDAGADAAADDGDPADPPAEAGSGIGEAVRDGKFEFTVTEVETGVAEVGDEWLSEQAQGQFVLVHMTVSNIGDEAQMLSGSNQTLVDTEGRQHSANTSAAIYLDDSDTFLNDINPGNSVDGIVVFDVPADAEPASIELHDSMFSGGVTVSLTD